MKKIEFEYRETLPNVNPAPRVPMTIEELIFSKVTERTRYLLVALKEVVALSDRKTDVWGRARAAIERAENEFLSDS